MNTGGRCDFDDGGSYKGTWHDGMSHGHGICTGPMGQGEYAGSWQFGFEVSGVYTWTSGNYYEGHWLQGKRHGVGVERKGHWLYRGEWTQGFKGRYGIRQSTTTGLKFEGTWTAGLQDGYGVETYADGGTYQGQWLRGLRHGYGVRQSVSYDLASRYQAGALPASTLTLPGSEREDEAALHDRDRRTEENRGGFVLVAKTTPNEDANRKKRLLLDKHGRPSIRKTIVNELRLIRQKSTGDIQEQPVRSGSRQSGGSVRSTVSAASQGSSTSGRTTGSVYSDEDTGSFISQLDVDHGDNIVEKYLGEWKNDKRSGYGICERSDGLKYEGEWFNNKKYGYGVTTMRDGSRLEGKYKNNILVSSGRTSKLFILRSSKVRDRVESAVLAAQKAADIARQKADIANARMTSARVKCEQAEEAAKTAVADAELARAKAREYSPNNVRQPVEKIITNRLQEEDLSAEFGDYDANPDQSQIQAQQPLKKFSFFKFKKDASLRGRNETLPRSTAAAETPVTQAFRISTSAFPTNTTAHQAALPTFSNASYTSTLPSSANNTRHMNDFRAAANEHVSFQDGYSSNVAVSGQVLLGNGEMPVDRGQPPVQRQRMPQNRQWTQDKPGGVGQSTSQGQQVVTREATLYALPQTIPVVNQGHGFDDSYNWVGYGDFRERRKSLPSIVKDKTEVSVTAGAAAAAATGTVAKTATLGNHLHSPTTGVPSARPQVDTYVIENGVRKRVKPLYPALPLPNRLSSTDQETRRLPRKLYELESPKMYRKGEKGSMPDVSAVKDADVLPREVVYAMSQQRREALIRERAEEERRRRNQIVLRLGDLKEWCEKRQVLVFVLALNISLATVFYSMLQ